MSLKIDDFAMIEVKISVVVITYNQEKSIIKALNSILMQKDYLHEVIVSDDCSSDNTWTLLKDYSAKYSELVKVYRNNGNLGIYGNLNEAYSHVTGSVIATLAGDDEYEPNCFRRAVSCINDAGVVGTPFLCFFNSERRFVDNRPNYIFKNSLSTSKFALSYSLRGKICEPMLFSAMILKYCNPSMDLGKCADQYWKYQQVYYSEAILFVNKVGFIYNAGIGVSVTASLKKTRESERLVYNKILTENEMKFGEKDLNYVRYLQKRNESYFCPSVGSMLTTTWSFMKGIDVNLGIRHIGIFDHIKYLIRFLPFAIGLKKME